MSRFNTLFQKMAAQKRPACIPFLMLGDPTLELSFAAINAVIKGGADAIELGIPFSDPIADGPIVQHAGVRALENGATLQKCLAIVKQIRVQHPNLPIGLLVYANLVFHEGLSFFYQQAAFAGVDAVLLPDVPSQEALPFSTAAKEHNIQPVLIATPTCVTQDFVTLSELSEGFTYVVTRAGVTGLDEKAQFAGLKNSVQALETIGAPPVVFGFGIKDAQDVVQAYAHGAKGVIIGSALIQEISKMTAAEIKNGTLLNSLVQQLFYGKPSLLA